MFKKQDVFFLLITTLLAIIVRYIGRDLISEDMILAFLPWFKTMKEGGGLSSLSRQVGDYSLLYQTIVALLTYIDIKPVYLFKMLSVTFDFMIAVSVGYFVLNCGSETVFNRKGKGRIFCLSYAIVLLVPTIFMNSAFWGQCDSIYTFYLLWSVWFLYKEKFSSSFFMLGWALAFKLQAILLFPLFGYYYFAKKRYSLSNLFITAFTFWLSGIVVHIYRWNVLENVNIYSNQVVMFKRMWMNVPSFWILIGDNYEKLHLLAIGLTLILLGVGFLMVITGKLQMDSLERIVALAVFIEWTCVVFLPAMHERYTYVMDLLLLMLALLNKRFIKYAFIAIITSCVTYSAYLFTNKGLNLPIVIIYIITWLLYSFTLFTKGFDENNEPIEHIKI